MWQKAKYKLYSEKKHTMTSAHRQRHDWFTEGVDHCQAVHLLEFKIPIMFKGARLFGLCEVKVTWTIIVPTQRSQQTESVPAPWWVLQPDCGGFSSSLVETSLHAEQTPPVVSKLCCFPPSFFMPGPSSRQIGDKIRLYTYRHALNRASHPAVADTALQEDLEEAQPATIVNGIIQDRNLIRPPYPDR